MKYDIILAGVGGQGILTIAYLLDNASVNRGLRFKQAEVHGMAQRGGAVYSHMRVSDQEVISDLIPEGRADMILSVEPLEVQRYVHFLGPDGVVVTNNQPFVNIPDYPEEDQVIDAITKLPNSVLFNAKAIALKAKSPRSQNVAIVGAATPFLPFEKEDFQSIIEDLFKRKGEKVVNANLSVLEMSYNAGLFYKKLLDAGVPNPDIFKLVNRVDQSSFDPELAPRFAQALKDKKDELDSLLGSLDEDTPCDEALLNKLA